MLKMEILKLTKLQYLLTITVEIISFFYLHEVFSFT